MEAVKKLKDTETAKIMLPTVIAFIPLLEENRTHIWKTPRRTFSFGGLPRNKLDVYYPREPPPDGGRTPILFWIYGGAFTSGDRILPAPYSLGYACVGAFFAQRGFLTIIPDYRLVPEIVYPAPPEDIRDAMTWVVNNTKKLTTKAVPNPDVDSIFLMGHSAGAVHASTALFHPDLLREISPHLRGVILHAGGYHFHPEGHKTGADELCAHYYGGPEETREKEPLGLLERASEEKIASLPPILMVVAEREPPWMQVVGEDFHKAVQSRTGKPVPWVICKGHNHISPNWALMTGEGEDWAYEVVRWMNQRLSSGNESAVTS